MKNLISVFIILSISCVFGENKNEKREGEGTNEVNNNLEKIANANEVLLLQINEGVNSINYYNTFTLKSFSELEDNYGLFCKARDEEGNVIASCFICNCGELAKKTITEPALEALKDAKKKN